MGLRNMVLWSFLVLYLLSPAPSIRSPLLLPGSSVSYSGSLALAILVNITLDDTSSLITYLPASSWHASTNSCTICLTPSEQLAYAGTWHDGTHIIPTVDNDDQSGTQADADDPPKPASSSLKRPASTSSSKAPTATGKGDDDGDGGDEDKGHSSSGKGKRRRVVESIRDLALRRRQDVDDNNPFFTPNLDSDDPGFVDTPVLAEFNFTGSAIYVYALVPLFVATSNSTPTFVNLSYTIDSQPAGNFLHAGSPSVSPSSNTTSYQRGVPVLAKTGLSEGPHTITVNVGPDSVFLLDYIVYSQEDDLRTNVSSTEGGSSSTTGPPTSSVTKNAMPSAALSQSVGTHSSKSHSVATFAGAVGGSVGLLSVLALSLAFSLYRRRVLARRRDRAYREARRDAASISESYHTDASEDGPPMQGPLPFIPRYFPGTVISTAPPPYSPPAPPSNSPTSALLGPPETPVPSMMWSSRRLGIIGDSESYAERPPPTPPPDGSGLGADLDDDYFAPPPSFPMAISTPIPAILAGLSGAPIASQSPGPRSPTPASPVIPLLAPPPSSRPPTLSLADQSPGAGPSSSRSRSVSITSGRASRHSLRVPTQDTEERVLTETDASSIVHSLYDSDRRSLERVESRYVLGSGTIPQGDREMRGQSNRGNDNSTLL